MEPCADRGQGARGDRPSRRGRRRGGGVVARGSPSSRRSRPSIRRRRGGQQKGRETSHGTAAKDLGGRPKPAAGDREGLGRRCRGRRRAAGASRPTGAAGSARTAHVRAVHAPTRCGCAPRDCPTVRSCPAPSTAQDWPPKRPPRRRRRGAAPDGAGQDERRNPVGRDSAVAGPRGGLLPAPAAGRPDPRRLLGASAPMRAWSLQTRPRMGSLGTNLIRSVAGTSERTHEGARLDPEPFGYDGSVAASGRRLSAA